MQTRSRYLFGGDGTTNRIAGLPVLSDLPVIAIALVALHSDPTASVLPSEFAAGATVITELQDRFGTAARLAQPLGRSIGTRYVWGVGDIHTYIMHRNTCQEQQHIQ